MCFCPVLLIYAMNFFLITKFSKIFDGACSEKKILKSAKNLDNTRFLDLVNKVKKLNYPKIFILKLYLKRFYYHIFSP